MWQSAVDSFKVYKHKYLSQVLRFLKHYVALDGVVVAIQFVLFWLESGSCCWFMRECSSFQLIGRAVWGNGRGFSYFEFSDCKRKRWSFCWYENSKITHRGVEKRCRWTSCWIMSRLVSCGNQDLHSRLLRFGPLGSHIINHKEEQIRNHYICLPTLPSCCRLDTLKVDIF